MFRSVACRSLRFTAAKSLSQRSVPVFRPSYINRPIINFGLPDHRSYCKNTDKDPKKPEESTKEETSTEEPTKEEGATKEGEKEHQEGEHEKGPEEQEGADEQLFGKKSFLGAGKINLSQIPPIHPYAIENTSTFYYGPLQYPASVLKQLSLTGCLLTTTLSPLITIFGDESIPYAARLFYSTIVLSVGLGTTGVVHKFVSPYVGEMELIRSDDAKGPKDAPVKEIKEKKEKVDGEEKVSAKDGDDTANEEDENEDEEEEEEEEEDDEFAAIKEDFDLTGYQINFSTPSFTGRRTWTLVDIDDIKVSSNAFGTANYETPEGKGMFLHDDHLQFTGHGWLIKHIHRSRTGQAEESPSTEEEEEKEEENTAEEKERK